MWEQNMWVGPNQQPIEPPNIPILFFDLVLLNRGIHFPEFPMAIKAPSSAQELFAHRWPQRCGLHGANIYLQKESNHLKNNHDTESVCFWESSAGFTEGDVLHSCFVCELTVCVEMKAETSPASPRGGAALVGSEEKKGH